MNARTEAKKLEVDHKTTKEMLDSEQQKNARLEQDVKNFREREKFLTRIKTLKLKRPWVVSLEINFLN